MNEERKEKKRRKKQIVTLISYSFLAGKKMDDGEISVMIKLALPWMMSTSTKASSIDEENLTETDNYF